MVEIRNESETIGIVRMVIVEHRGVPIHLSETFRDSNPAIERFSTNSRTMGIVSSNTHRHKFTPSLSLFFGCEYHKKLCLTTHHVNTIAWFISQIPCGLWLPSHRLGTSNSNTRLSLILIQSSTRLHFRFIYQALWGLEISEFLEIFETCNRKHSDSIV